MSIVRFLLLLVDCIVFLLFFEYAYVKIKIFIKYCIQIFINLGLIFKSRSDYLSAALISASISVRAIPDKLNPVTLGLWQITILF